MDEPPDGQPSAHPPRVRDMPAPRESTGIAGAAMRAVFTWPYRAILAGLYRAGVRPWQLTVASLLANAVVGWLLLTDRRALPGAVLIAAGTFDVFDGAVARLRGEDRRVGAFLDSVLDRIGDMILFGCLYWAEARQGHELNAALALVTLVTALMVSHIRAEAEAAGLSLSEGFFQRLERYIAVVIGLIVPRALTPMLVVLVVLGSLTVLQRGWSAIRHLPRGGAG